MELERDFGLESTDFFTIRNLPTVPARATTPLYGGSRMARESDLQAYLHPSEDAGQTVLNDVSFLLESTDGRSLRGMFKHPFFIPAETRRRNMLVIGQTGAQTRAHIITLAVSDISHPRESVVIIDGKGDLHQKLSPVVDRYRPGTRIMVINLTNRKRTTHAWNPHAVNLDSQSALEDAHNFCAASQTRTYNTDSPFWDGSAARWIAGLMFCLRASRGAVCPADVYEALELPRPELLALLKDRANVPFASAVASFLESGSHNAETVLATAQMYYRIFQDLDIASVTSTEEFRFDTLFKRPTVLILEISQRDIERVRPLVNQFFLQIFREAAWYAETQPGCRLPIPLNLYMDDFAASMGRIPEMGRHLHLSRSRDIRVVAAIQSLNQIDHFYGSEAGSVVSGFSTYIFKSPVSQADAEWASAHSGMMTVEAIDTNEQLNPNYVNGWEEVSRTTRLIGRRVLLPEDVRLAPEHFLYGRASTIILPDVPVFQAWFRPAFDTPELAEPMAMASKKPRKKSLRRKPLEWKSWRNLQSSPVATSNGSFSDTRNMDEKEIRARLKVTKNVLDYENATDTAKRWWQAFEVENKHRLSTCLATGRKSWRTARLQSPSSSWRMCTEYRQHPSQPVLPGLHSVEEGGRTEEA